MLELRASATLAMTNTALQTTADLLQATPDEGDAFKSLDDQIEAIYGHHGSAQLVDREGNATEIPDAALRALRLIVRRMAHGERLALVSHGEELTTQQAADLLHVSRPHLVKLLDRGDIPSHKVGSHRRVQTADLLAYRAKRDAMRRAKLDELVRISQELPGGYR
jgi:excisionase family DNA binding protein